MQAIIRYELVINEALRSALMLDTPDEQIDEFIRFFGKHIGCDRIYIFEDNKKEHVTDNTYEWCAVKALKVKLIIYKALIWISSIGGTKLLIRKKM